MGKWDWRAEGTAGGARCVEMEVRISWRRVEDGLEEGRGMDGWMSRWAEEKRRSIDSKGLCWGWLT